MRISLIFINTLCFYCKWNETDLQNLNEYTHNAEPSPQVWSTWETIIITDKKIITDNNI